MKLYIARDSDGTVCLYTKKPIRQDYIFGFGYDPDGGQCAEVPCLNIGEVYELNFV